MRARENFGFVFQKLPVNMVLVTAVSVHCEYGDILKIYTYYLKIPKRLQLIFVTSQGTDKAI